MKKLSRTSSFVVAITMTAALFAGMLTGARAVQAVTFDWATIGDIGNADDVHGDGYGGVDYEYRISKHEVTNAQYTEFLNAVATTGPLSLYNHNMGIIPTGNGYAVKPDAVGQGPGGTDYTYGDKPVDHVSWTDTLRFANWLHNGQGNGGTESGVYTISCPSLSCITAIDRLAGAKFFLPSEDEWYKAAYYDGSTDTYFDYATGTDTAPTNNLPSADTGNSANYDDVAGNSSYPLTDVGDYGLSASPYGTFDQTGNVWEWNEDRVGPFERGYRGGSYDASVGIVGASSRFWLDPTEEFVFGYGILGFRVASAAVPEPSTYVMAAMGLLALGLMSPRRKGGRRWRRA